MVITGRIYDIVIKDEKSAQLILRKKDGDKIVFWAITIWGFWKEKAFNELKLKPKDKIRGKLHIKANKWNDKWYNDLYFKEVYMVEAASPMLGRGELFVNTVEDDGFLVDEDSGEILE